MRSTNGYQPIDIITTIGPSSWTEDVIRAQLLEGVTCIRFPLAKETPELHLQRAGLIRQIASELSVSVELMADLPGGKPRLTNAVPVTVLANRQYKISLIQDAYDYDFSVEPVPDVIPQEGDVFIIGDGENRFEVQHANEKTLVGTFSVSGSLDQRRAFIPFQSSCTIKSFTERDRELAKKIAPHFDSLAFSFVDSSATVVSIRDWLEHELGWAPKLIAKIETVRGTLESAKIAEVADKVMLGRGDLFVQIGYEKFWAAEKVVLSNCRKLGRYVIAATGFLDSFDLNGVPSRSECIDICTALDLGADALMLSAETTIGKKPVEVVKTLVRLIYGWQQERHQAEFPRSGRP